jgi:hypothetical protein
LAKSKISAPAEEALESNETLNTIEYWHHRFLFNNNISDEKSLKRELAFLLSSQYASRAHASANFEIYAAYEKGLISLPEQIHSFLFPEKQPEPEKPLTRLLHSMRIKTRKRIRRWTGQDRAEQYRMIDEVLKYMETSLEGKNDN